MLQNKLDQILKQKLEGYSVEPPDSLWNKIEQQLPPTTPWYDKYKYLLLLLLLISTSVGSVLVYENLIKPEPNNFNTELLDNNQYKEQQNNKISNNNIDKSNITKIKSDKINNNSNTSTSNTTTKSTTLSTVTSSKQNSVQQHQNNINQYKKVSSSNNNTSSANQYQANKNNISNKSNKIKANKTSKNKQNKNTTNTNLATVNTNTTSNNYDEQFTNNIERRKENTSNTQMLASIDVSKIDIATPSTKELLSSLVSQKATINTNKTIAGIDDIGEEKEAMLQNLNEFAGYDINKGFHFGALMGLHTNFMDNKVFNKEQLSNTSNKIDFGKAFGVNIGYDFSSRYGFQTEIQYNEAGKTIEDNSNGTAIKREVNLNNLRIPLLFKYKISYINNYNSKPIVLNFLAGPQASFLIGKSYDIDGKESSTNQLNYSKTNIGFAGGVDVDLYMKRNFYFTIGARTSADFSMKKGTPNNYQIGVTTQFNFRMPKKIK